MSDQLRVAEKAWAADQSTEAFCRLYVTRKRCGLVPESAQGQTPTEFTSVVRGNSVDDYDWPEVFKYANDGGKPDQDYDGDGACPRKAGSTDPSEAPFGLGDVRYVIGLGEGENDGLDWIALVELWDGRFGFVAAGCDYTGWG